MEDLIQELVELTEALDNQKRVDLVRRYLISRIENMKLFSAKRRAMLLEGLHFTIEKETTT